MLETLDTVTTVKCSFLQLVACKQSTVTKHQLICRPHKFQRTGIDMQWTAGAKLFEAIQDVPEDPADIDCLDDLCHNDNSQSVATFDAFIENFVKHKFANIMKACMNHQKFLIPIEKPKALTIQEFTSPLQCHNEAILPQLPGAPAEAVEASHDDNEIKNLAFNAMPETWRDDHDMLFDLNDADLDLLVTCVEKKNTLSKRKKSNTGNSNDNQDDNHGNRKPNQGKD